MSVFRLEQLERRETALSLLVGFIDSNRLINAPRVSGQLPKVRHIDNHSGSRDARIGSGRSDLGESAVVDSRLKMVAEIFISYAHRDGAKIATRLLADLESASFTTWLATSWRKNAGVSFVL